MSEHLEKILEQTTVLRAPIAGDAPGGADISLEPEFESIKAEIEKLTSLEGGSPDWGRVAKDAEDLLTNRTKDWRLACWFTVGGGHTSGWTGLVRGLAVLRALTQDDLWGEALPKRDKARVNIVAWLAERAQPVVNELSISLADGDDVRVVAELVQELNRTLADKLGDAYQGIRGLVAASKSRIGDIPEPPPPPPPTPPPAAPSEYADDEDDAAPAQAHAPVASGPANGVVLSTAANDADETTGRIATALAGLARSLAMQNPARAWAYTLHRQAIWMRVEGAEPAAQSGPDPALRERLASLFSEARWIELVLAGEEASAQNPLWLDPHRFVALALEHLGSAFNEAREVVGRAASDFARRFGSRLSEGRFGDDTAVASIETIAWLETESKRWLRATDADVARDEDKELAARFADARRLVAGGRHAEGLATAMQLARRGANPRARFRASLDVARLASEAGAHEIARPLLESLVAMAEKHDLETWEPVLAARLQAGLYRCLPDSPERDHAFVALCRINPGRALRLRGGARAAPVARAAPAIAMPAPQQPETMSYASDEPSYEQSYAEPEPAPHQSSSSSSEWADDDD